MKNKFLAAVMGSILLVCAAVPAPAQKDSLTTTIEFCYVSLQAYRSGPEGKKAVNEALALMPATQQRAVAIVCRAFTSGYDQGQRDVRNIT